MRGIQAAMLVIGDPIANPVTLGVEVRGFRAPAEKSDAGLVFKARQKPGRHDLLHHPRTVVKARVWWNNQHCRATRVATVQNGDTPEACQLTMITQL